jgi:DNA helicase-2/ATP-dependent DNA helicase PcrA
MTQLGPVGVHACVASCHYRAQMDRVLQSPPNALGRVLGGLTESQHIAVTSDAAPLCVIAGAGSGKTRVLTRRVARRILDGSGDADRTLVLTFTRKAADELKKRLRRLEVPAVHAGTFHAVAYAQLRRHWSDQGRKFPALVDSPTRFVKKLLAESSHRNPEQSLVTSVCNEISWARAKVLSAEDYPAAAKRARRSSVDLDLVATIYADYSVTKERRGVIDLDDLIEKCADLLEHDESFASAQRWWYRHFFVDELQDLNPAQWRLLTAWLGDRDDLFVVGDPLQAVYGWNGADKNLLGEIVELLPGTAVLRLDDNHRCSPNVVEVARAVLGTQEGPSRIRSTHDDTGRVPLIRDFEDDMSEATEVARWLRECHRPGSGWSSLAVLARTNSRLDSVEVALKRAGIPAVRRGGAQRQQHAAIAALRSMRRDTRLRAALADLAAELDDLDWLASEIDEICAESPDADVGQFLLWRAAVSDAEDGGGSAELDAVQLATFHRAKGLEWHAVAVVGLEAGMVPIAHATRSSELEEERRALYVALTRAEVDLWCSWAKTRSVNDRTWTCEPSPYLAAMRTAARDLQPPDSVPMSVRISELRSKLAPV